MSRKSFNISISPNGSVTMIYSDDHVGFLDKLGAPVVTRASFVEPAEGGWTADMSPIAKGVILGPYKLRQEALDAEAAWLNKRLFADGSAA